MKRSLPIPKGPKQELFFAYLNSELAQRAESSLAMRGFTPDGSFVSKVNTVFTEAFGQLNLQWVFVTSPDGDLVSVEVFPAAESVEGRPADWELVVHGILDSALTSALIESRTATFRRELLYYIGPRLDGEYKLPDMRLAPAPLEDPWPGLVNAERIAVLDFEVDAIDIQDANYLAAEFSRRWAARLSLILDLHLYGHVGEHVWVYVTDRDRDRVKVADEDRNLRLNRGVRDLPTPTAMPRKGIECALGEPGSPLSTYVVSPPTLKIPSETRRIMRGINGLPEPVQDAFDGAARMYQIGLWLSSRFPSAALAYRVAAIDALAQIEPNCDQSFSNFMRKYSPGLTDPQLDYLHREIRSAHFHAGKFGLGEYSVQRPHDLVPGGPEAEKKSWARYQFFGATRKALVNWMLSIAAAEKESAARASA